MLLLSVGSEDSWASQGALDLGFHPWVRKIPCRRNGNPLQSSCLGNPWTGEPGRLHSMRSQRVGHDWARTHEDSYLTSLSLNFLCYESKTRLTCQVIGLLGQSEWNSQCKVLNPFPGPEESDKSSKATGQVCSQQVGAGVPRDRTREGRSKEEIAPSGWGGVTGITTSRRLPSTTLSRVTNWCFSLPAGNMQPQRKSINEV